MRGLTESVWQVYESGSPSELGDLRRIHLKPHRFNALFFLDTGDTASRRHMILFSIQEEAGRSYFRYMIETGVHYIIRMLTPDAKCLCSL